MNEYELADYAASVMSNFLSAGDELGAHKAQPMSETYEFIKIQKDD